MFMKIALLLWFIALLLSFTAKDKGRSWMPRLFLGGLCLLLLGFFLKLIGRVI